MPPVSFTASTIMRISSSVTESALFVDLTPNSLNIPADTAPLTIANGLNTARNTLYTPQLFKMNFSPTLPEMQSFFGMPTPKVHITRASRQLIITNEHMPII